LSTTRPFDRLYFYGEDRPIHISYGPNQDRQVVRMTLGKSGRLVPRVVGRAPLSSLERDKEKSVAFSNVQGAFDHSAPPNVSSQRAGKQHLHHPGDHNSNDRQPRRLLRLVEGTEQTRQFTDVRRNLVPCEAVRQAL
jgi:hypothetical protein